MSATHDCRDRRHTNMDSACQALANCVADLMAFPGDQGVSLLVADRLARITAELAAFRARDLINMRAVEVSA